MNKFTQAVDKIYAADNRYKPDAYEFVILGLKFTQKKLKKADVSGQELTKGLRDYAIDQYGPFAEKVLGHWGISQTVDFGNIVFNLIEKKLLSKTKQDSLSDFNEVYDFKKAFLNILAESIDSVIAEKK